MKLGRANTIALWITCGLQFYLALRPLRSKELKSKEKCLDLENNVDPLAS